MTLLSMIACPVIIKASQRSNSLELSAHLQSDENERVTMIDTYGLNAQDIDGAIKEMMTVAAGSAATQPLFHVSISPHPDEIMTEKDWKFAWDLYTERMGLEGLQHATVGHDKHDRHHQHRAYNRVDPATLKARNLPWTRVKNERIARELEVRLGHKIVPGKFNAAVARQLEKEGLHDIADRLREIEKASSDGPAYTHAEWQQLKRGKPIDIERACLADAWERSHDAVSFQQALKVAGFVIAQGKRQVVVVNATGAVIPLKRAINQARKKSCQRQPGITLSELKARLPAKLDTVEHTQMLNEPARRAAESIRREAYALPEVGQLTLRPRKTVKPVPAPCSGSSLNSSLEPSDPLWLQRRRRQYHRAYKRPIPPELVRYMRFAMDQQGGIWLNNRYGALIDRGNQIDVRLSGNKVELMAEVAVKLALAKGWTDVKVSGDEAFKHAVMKSAAKHGLTLDLSDPQNHQLWQQANPDLSPEPSPEPPITIDEAQLEPENTTTDEEPPSPAPSPTMR